MDLLLSLLYGTRTAESAHVASLQDLAPCWGVNYSTLKRATFVDIA